MAKQPVFVAISLAQSAVVWFSMLPVMIISVRTDKRGACGDGGGDPEGEASWDEISESEASWDELSESILPVSWHTHCRPMHLPQKFAG